MEREDVGGRRDARSPARSERFRDAQSQPTSRYDVSSSDPRPGGRYSARYDSSGPPPPPHPVPTDQPAAAEGFRRSSPRREQAPHGGRGGALVFDAPPNPTLIIKNLPARVDDEMLMRELASFHPIRAHTIRDRDSGTSRGFAFVDFASVELATRVINTFEYIPLVVADRVVALGYASTRRPPPLTQDAHRPEHPHRDAAPYGDEHRASERSSWPPRFDWLCDQCHSTNFSRRTQCFRCRAPKGERPREVPADFSLSRASPNARHAAAHDAEPHRHYDDRGRDGYGSRSRSPERRSYGSQRHEHDAGAAPSNVLVARQLPMDVDEGQLQVAFAACRGARAIRLVRDRLTSESRGFAFVEFESVDAARQALETSQDLPVGTGYARLSFAYEAYHPRGRRSSSAEGSREPYEAEYYAQTEDPGHASSIAATALEQAQWALANGYRRSAGADADDAQQPTDISDDVNALLESAAEAARPQIEEPRKPWPPPFETNGGSYVYASDVGLYWDPDSMFYYSPATKLYLSLFLGKYFRCDELGAAASDGNAFQEVTPPVPIDDTPFVQATNAQHPTTPQQSTTATTTAASSTTTKPTSGGVSLSLKLPAKKKAPVSFGLKAPTASSGKKFKTACSAGDAAGPAAFASTAAPIVGAMPPAGVMRKSAQDIAKWSQVQRKTKLEEQQQQQQQHAGSGSHAPASRLPFDSPSEAARVLDKAPTAAAKPVEPPRPTPAAVTPPSIVDELANTAAEVPICLLCRRKFNSMEVLRKHEAMSKLHLDNLAKARQDKDAVAAQYRERERAAAAAHEKRARDAASQEMEAKRQRLAEAIASSKPAQEAKATAALEQGIGGKMLKMMGWKSGEGLGKRGTGITAPISATSNSNSGGSSTTAGLGAKAAAPPVALPESASFKERVQSFTRARYDAARANGL